MGVLQVVAGGVTRKIGCGGSGPGAAFADTFNRTDSTTTINPASDGGTWILDNSASYGILSNTLYALTANGANGRIRRNLGTIGATITMALTKHGTTGDIVFAWIGYDPTADTGYAVGWNSFGQVLLYRWNDGGVSLTEVSRLSTGAGWNDSSTTVVFAYDPATATLTAHQDGALLGTITDTSNFATGTWAGYADNLSEAAGGVRLDNITAAQLGTPVAPTSGRLKLYADGRIWQEACDGDDLTSAHPIKIDLPSGVTVAVCMVPAGPTDIAPATGWFSLAGGGDGVEEPTAIYRTDPARSARVFGDSGTGNYALTLTGLIVGHTYRIGCYVRHDATSTPTTSDAFFHARYATTRTSADINPMPLTTWALAEATFVADSTTDDMLWQLAAANSGPPYDFSVWIADWYAIDEGP